MNITFIGGGNMAAALIGGLVSGGAATRDFRVVDPLAAQRENLAARFPGVGLFSDLSAGAVEGAEIAILAVKPQQMRAAAEALAPYASLVPVILTIAAGTRLADLSLWLGGYSRLVRAMPNTPALVGAGISGLFASLAVDARNRRNVARVLEAVGQVIWCEREELLDAVTGVSGSGPAYVFYFLEGLEEAARELGFNAADARTLAYATFAGAIKLAQGSSESSATLRERVTSKGGTTERALAELDAGAVKRKFIDAVKAAAARARELGETVSTKAP